MSSQWAPAWTRERAEAAEAAGHDVRWHVVSEPDPETGALSWITVDGEIVYTAGVAGWRDDA